MQFRKPYREFLMKKTSISDNMHCTLQLLADCGAVWRMVKIKVQSRRLAAWPMPGTVAATVAGVFESMSIQFLRVLVYIYV